MYPFYYSLLSSEAKNVYDAIFCSLFDEKTDITVNLSRLKNGELHMIIDSVFNDHPELIYEQNWKCEYSVIGIRFKTPVMSVYRHKENARFLIDFRGSVKQYCLTDYDKVKYVHDFIINSVQYDEEEARTYIRNDNNHNALGALCTGKSVCEGIARLTQLLLHVCGIQAIICVGRTTENLRQDIGHAWNVVCINGNYYHLDVSHDVCLTSKKNQKSYCYFNLTYEDITKDHIIGNDSAFRALQCSSNKHNYFHYNKCFYSSPDDISKAVEAIFKETIASKQQAKYFQFKISDRMIRQYNIPWYLVCLTAIYKVIDTYNKQGNIRIVYDEPYYNINQGVMAINFKFTY